jgi:inorganic pyrophosphatase
MIRMLIEAEAGSRNKSLYNEKTLELKETRRVSQPYPYPYGFILGTSSEDSDAVDCYLITNEKLNAGVVVECEPIALLEQHEDDEIDHKVLAALPDQQMKITQELLKEIQDFIYAIFAEYPEIKIRVGPIHPREAALSHILIHRKNERADE